MLSTVRAAMFALGFLTLSAQAQWQSAPSFPPSGTGRQYAVGLNLGGTLYAVGGTPWTNGGDEDGSVHTLDVLAFLNAWSEGDSAADFNGDGAVNTLDLLAFLNAWSAGC